MTAAKTGSNVFSGTIYQTTGPAFDATPFDSHQVVATAVGTGSLTFTDANNGTFAYTVNGVSQTKGITREVFAVLPTCTFNALNDLSTATNYQDLWWSSPAGSESGWGISLAHQGDTIFGTWFTYDHDHSPMWLAFTANKTPTGTYSGDLLRTVGPAFNAVPFDPASVQATSVGYRDAELPRWQPRDACVHRQRSGPSQIDHAPGIPKPRNDLSLMRRCDRASDSPATASSASPAARAAIRWRRSRSSRSRTTDRGAGRRSGIHSPQPTPSAGR